MQVRRLLLLCPLAFALAPPAARASFDLTGQTRDVGVTVTQRTLSCSPPPTGCSVLSTTNFSDSESAADFSPFSATASVSPFTTIFSTQASTLSAASLVAQGNGTHSGSGALTTPPNIYTTVESTSATLHRVGFDVDAATPYRLSGSARSTGGLSANATTRITLKTSGGAKLAEVVAATDSNCQDQSCAVVGPLPVASYGVLAPGSYVLEVEASGAASPFYFANNLLALTSTWDYAVRLDEVQVPGLSPAGLALLAAACLLAAWPGLARLRRERA
jgi:hypothetical protein